MTSTKPNPTPCIASGEVNGMVAVIIDSFSMIVPRTRCSAYNAMRPCTGVS